MHIVELEKGEYTVAAIAAGVDANGDPFCPVLEFLEGLPDKFQSSADGFISLFEQYAKFGRNGVTSGQFHEANKEEGIWEFIKGRLRIYCFKDPSKKSLILLSNGAIKTTQKAAGKDVRAAVRARDAYLLAASQQQITVHSVDAGEEN